MKTKEITNQKIESILSIIEIGCTLQDIFDIIDEIHPDYDARHIPALYAHKTDDYLYEIKNIVNDKIYVGSTNGVVRRIVEHIFASSSKVMKKDIGKYGRVSFVVRGWKENKDQEYIHMNKYDKEVLYNKRLK
jgi:hypothetical protein